MDQIRLIVQASMPETFELTLGPHPHPRLKVTHCYHAEREVDPDPEAVAKLVKSVRTLRLPAKPEDALCGLDGVTYTIRFSKGTAAAEYSWWCEPPAGWEPLAGIAKQIMALAGRKGRLSGFNLRDPDSVSDTPYT
jgi:hypothetical protein